MQAHECTHTHTHTHTHTLWCSWLLLCILEPVVMEIEPAFGRHIGGVLLGQGGTSLLTTLLFSLFSALIIREMGALRER